MSAIETTRVGSLRGRVDRQRQAAAVRGRDVDHPLVAGARAFDSVADGSSAARTMRERMVIELGAPILRDRVAARAAVPFRADVVGDFAVDAEHLFLRRVPLEIREVRRARLLGARRGGPAKSMARR